MKMASSCFRNSVTILFICTSLYVNAQQSRFSGGLLLNINGIELKGKDEAHYWNANRSGKEIGGTMGVSAGLFVKHDITKKFFSTMELRYISKGSIYGFTSLVSTQSFETLYLNYIELPVLIGYKIKPAIRTWYFESGLAYAILISSNIEANDLVNRIGTPNANSFKETDISWMGSLKFPLVRKWKEHLLLGLRVSRSIISIHNYYKLYNFDYGVEINYRFN